MIRRPTTSECLLVHVMKRLSCRSQKASAATNSLCIELDPVVDLSLSPDQYDSDEVLLVDRARKWLTVRHDLPADLGISLIPWVLLAVAGMTGVLSGLGSRWFTDDERQVQVFWFVSVVVAHAFILLISVAFLGFLIWLPRNSAPISSSIGLRHWIRRKFVDCLVWVVRHVTAVKPLPTNDANEHSRIEVWAAITDVLCENRSVRLLLAMAMHLLWLTALTSALIGLVWRTAAEEYKFSWRTTWVVTSSVGSGLSRLSAIGPTQRLMETHPIDEAAIDYLRKSPEQLSQEELEWRRQQQSAGLTKSEIAKHWEQRTMTIQRAWLCTLVDFILLLAVLPRALAFVATVLLWRRERNAECCLNLSDPYYAELIALLRGTTPRFVPGTAGITDLAVAVTDNTATMPPAATSSQESPPSLTESAMHLWLAGYNLDPPAVSSWQLPPVLMAAKWIERGKLVGATSRCEFLDELRATRSQGPLRLILFVPTGMTPDQNLVRFLQDARNSLSAQHELLVVLSDLETLRINYGNDADKVRRRLELWSQKCRDAGLDDGDWLEFDHLTLTSGSREQFAQRLTHWLAGCLPVKRGRHWAGHLRVAFAEIYRVLKELPETPPPDSMIERTQALHEQLTRLYCGNRSSADRLDILRCALPQHMEQARSRMSDALKVMGSSFSEDRMRELKDVLECQIVGPLAWWQSLRRVNWRWSVAGGVLCAVAAPIGVLATAGMSALPFVMPAALFGGVTGTATTAVAMTVAVEKVFSRLRFLVTRPDGADSSFAASANGSSQIGLDELIRSSVLWTLVLELQGTPEVVLAETLNELTSEVGKQPIDRFADAEACLAQVEQRYHQLRMED
ncbi:MAG: DUF2868 domain-containing protein [Planctomycetia bacterium]|nr:DUF2868 domain-containing protein [Planctomycetia bacterium]